MMSPLVCVIDASVAIKIFMAEALSDRATKLFDSLANEPGTVFHALELLYAECANVFWKHLQRGNISDSQAVANLTNLFKLPLAIMPLHGLASDALQLAIVHGISVYDACYGLAHQ